MLIDSPLPSRLLHRGRASAACWRARAAAGVGEMVTIGTTLDAVAGGAGASPRRMPNVWCTVGVHPHEAAEEPVPDARGRSPRWPAIRKVIGIGEVRARLLLRHGAARRAAGRASAPISAAARQAGLPLAIHARDADDDIAAILREERDSGGDFAFLLHCFSSGAGAGRGGGGAGRLCQLLGHPDLPAIAANCGRSPAIFRRDRLLVETDAPYLAPVPFRGKRNEPAFVAHTAAVLAEVRGLEPEALGRPDDGEFPPPVPQGGLSRDAGDRSSARGGSAGVPLIGGADGGGDWGACDPAEPRNRRTRTSIVVESDAGTRLLVDTGAGPADAVAGLPGAAGRRGALHPCACRPHHRPRRRARCSTASPAGRSTPSPRAATLDELTRRFDYAFKPWQPPGFFRPVLVPQRVTAGDTVETAGMRSGCSTRTTGSSTRSACASAASAIRPMWSDLDEAALAALEGVDTWVVGCFQRHGRTRRTRIWTGAGMGAPGRRAADGADAYGHRHGLGLAAATCRPVSSRAMTAWCWRWRTKPTGTADNFNPDFPSSVLRQWAALLAGFRSGVLVLPHPKLGVISSGRAAPAPVERKSPFEGRAAPAPAASEFGERPRDLGLLHPDFVGERTLIEPPPLRPVEPGREPEEDP